MENENTNECLGSAAGVIPARQCACSPPMQSAAGPSLFRLTVDFDAHHMHDASEIAWIFLSRLPAGTQYSIKALR